MPNDFDDIRKIINNSGNTFHCKVLKYFKEKGWEVLVSPYYNDNASNKPREIDLIAEKAFEQKGHSGEYCTVNVKLFIECKYISQDTVFWFFDKDNQKAEDLIVQTTPLHHNNTYTQKHHYLQDNDRVAKLFADGRKKNAENEIFYKALNQSLNAMVYFRDENSIIQLPSSRDGYVKHIANYPLIICNDFGKLYKVDIDGDTEPSKIDDNFQLEVNYAFLDSKRKHRNEYFLIDIIGFDLLDQFLEKIEADTKVINFFLHQ